MAKKIMSMYWFIILFIVAAGVFMMVISYYGKPYDIRMIEANVLLNKVADCLDGGDGLKMDITNENFLEKCHLSLDFDGEYYVEIQELGIAKGNVNWKGVCSLPGQTSVVCLERSFYVLDNQDEKFIKILSVVRNTEKNVK